MCRVTLEKSKTMKYHRQTKSDHKNQKKLEKTTQKDYHSDITNPGLKKSGKYKKKTYKSCMGKTRSLTKFQLENGCDNMITQPNKLKTDHNKMGNTSEI
jgi:hypothetical protein